MKPRIAFCFSGQARTFDSTYSYFKKNLFDTALKQGFEYDIFSAVEDDADAEKILILNPKSVERISSRNVTSLILEKYGNFIKENINKNYYLSQLLYYKFENCLQQFYKIGRADFLRIQEEEKSKKLYDIVIRLRFDVILFDEFDFHKILDEIQSNNSLLVNFASNESKTKEIYDLIVIGGSENMREYSSIFYKVEQGFIKSEFTIFQRTLLFITAPLLFLRKYFDKICRRGSWAHHLLNLVYSAYGLLIEKMGIPLYSFEKILLTYLEQKNLNLTDSKINYILLRKPPEESICKFFYKKKYIN